MKNDEEYAAFEKEYEAFEKEYEAWQKGTSAFFDEIREFVIYGDVVLDKESKAIEFTEPSYPFANWHMEEDEMEYIIGNDAFDFVIAKTSEIIVDSPKDFIYVRPLFTGCAVAKFDNLTNALMYILNYIKDGHTKLHKRWTYRKRLI
jgi:hypothetical protein